jgi:hypothetical protein
MPTSRRARHGRRLTTLTVVATVVTLLGGPAAASAANDPAGFITKAPPMLTATADGVDVKPLLTVGEMIGSYRFESIPDGIAVDPRGHLTFDIYVNHETSKVPFPFNAGTGVGLTDFDNAQLSHLVMKRGSGRILSRLLYTSDAADEGLV